METPVRKKILFVITKSNWGGAQRYVFDVATHLDRARFEIAVALGGTGELQRKLTAVGIRVIPLQSVQRDISVSADVGGFFSLYRIMRVYKPEVVHLNSSKAGGLGALSARLLGVPRIIFTAHGWPFAEKRNFVWRLFALLGSWATALLSHKIICVSDHDLRIAERMPFIGHKAVRIYNGIEQNMVLGFGNMIRDAFPTGVRVTGTIGELTRNKNQVALIEEAKNDPDMYVAIVGEGEDRLYLMKKIEEYGLEARVKLFGFMPASEALRGFDVFALPSIKEGLPYVLLEAKAAGLPIEASRVGGVGEILDAKDMGDFSLERMMQKTIALYNS
jgi:glycosyltransferase involved in cell wall biosynthesis